jgi:hypothetical protein
MLRLTLPPFVYGPRTQLFNLATKPRMKLRELCATLVVYDSSKACITGVKASGTVPSWMTKPFLTEEEYRLPLRSMQPVMVGPHVVDGASWAILLRSCEQLYANASMSPFPERR